MNKKMNLLVTFILCILSIMGIAVWGTLPENHNPIRITEIVIDDFDQLNDDGDKFKDVMNIINLQNSIYSFTYTITPSEAFTDIRATASRAGIRVQVDMSTQTVYVFFDLEHIGRTVTIQVRDQLTQRYDEITLWFKQPGEITVPDLD